MSLYFLKQIIMTMGVSLFREREPEGVVWDTTTVEKPRLLLYSRDKLVAAIRSYRLRLFTRRVASVLTALLSFRL